MSQLTRLEINKLVYKYIGVNGGYLGDFSYRTHREFYAQLELDSQHVRQIRRVQIAHSTISYFQMLGAQCFEQLGEAGSIEVVMPSPALLSCPEDEIRGVIAHEFAHVVLDHHKHGESGERTAYEWAKPDEEAADRLAESWGFKLPQSHTDRL